MSKYVARLIAVSCIALLAGGISAQDSGSAVPRLISFGGTLKDALGKPVSGPVTVTFSLFAEQEGGTALWSETQTVEPDAGGKYTVFLGASNAAGLPLELFTTGAARWLAVEPGPPAAVEPARILLVGVPYALKAADADTLGGKPASAFVTAPAQSAQSSASPELMVVPGSSITPTAAPTGGGTADYVPLWTSGTNLGNSILFQSGSVMEVNGTLELPSLGSAISSTGYDSRPLDLFASAYSSSVNEAVPQHFRWQAEPVSNDTSAASGKIDLLYASGTATPSETGLSINSKGVITFASGQTLPAVTGNETVSGTVSATQLISTAASGTAPLMVTSATQVPNLNASYLGGLSASAFATHGANAFTGTQAITGNLNLTGSINGALILQGNVKDPNTGWTSANVIGGYAGNAVTNGATGATVSGGGSGGLPNTVSADFGTVTGGSYNSASGESSTVAGGSDNTASGYYSTVAGGISNAASGYYSTVAGGLFNTASGPYSFAAGQYAKATDSGSFVWCQANGAACDSVGTNSFEVAVNGPIYFYDGPGGAGCYLSAGSGSWTCSSDRNLKNDIRAIDARTVLERVAQMPISQWSMKADADGHQHIGPMAQDFYAAFGLGESDKYIAQGDAQGVALASIQGLYQLVQVVQESLQHKDRQIRILEARVRSLEKQNKRSRSNPVRHPF